MAAVKVEILGKEYVLRSGSGEDRVQRVVEYLNARLNEVLSQTTTSSNMATAVLAALNITNELLQLQDAQTSLLKEIEARSEKMLARLEQLEE